MGVRAVLIVIGILGCASQAHGQGFPKLDANAQLRMELEYERPKPIDASGVDNDVIRGGISMLGYGGTERIGLLAGVDTHYGAGLGGGFAYSFNFKMLGVGFPLGKSVLFGVMTGIGFSGMTGNVPFSSQFPVEAVLEMRLGNHVHISGWGRARWLNDNSREVDTELGIGHELDIGLAFRVGKGKTRGIARWGRGTFIAGVYKERGDSQMFGLMIGHGISTSFHPRSSSSRPFMPTVRGR